MIASRATWRSSRSWRRKPASDLAGMPLSAASLSPGPIGRGCRTRNTCRSRGCCFMTLDIRSVERGGRSGCGREPMSDNTRTTLLIGRISALVLLLLAVAYGIGGSMIEYAFSSDPLGPRVMRDACGSAWPARAALSEVPGSAEGFPTGSSLLRVLAVPATLIVCVALFEPLGFTISIFLLTAVTGWIFGASPKLSIIAAWSTPPSGGSFSPSCSRSTCRPAPSSADRRGPERTIP